MIRHLSNEKLTDLQIEKDQQSFRQTFEAMASWARATTEQDDEFWQNQRNAIWSQISSAESRPARRIPLPAWTLAGAMLVVSGWMMQDRTAIAPRRASVDPDHELLLEVERAVGSDGPAALDPAALLAEEMVQQLPAINSPVHKKEPRHEN